MNYKYLFGPVPSRRLGYSLGVDLVPFKTCSFDCVYCECGHTTSLKSERNEYVPVEEVIAELKHFLKDLPSIDHITFSGSGEPTLHSGIGRIIRFLKENYPEYKLALLTNGSLLTEKKVRSQLYSLDLVIPSLDAGSEKTYRKINRPCKEAADLDSVIQGLIAFREEFQGDFWMEVFIVPGINDSPQEIELIRKVLQKIKPDKVQLNTLDRPGAEDALLPATVGSLETIAKALGEKVEVVTYSSDNKKIQGSYRDIEEAIKQMIARRPCTVEDLSRSLGVVEEKIQICLKELLKQKKIVGKKSSRGIFYSLEKKDDL